MTWKFTDCLTCGTKIWLSPGDMDALVRSKQKFYCPFGHTQHFCDDQGVLGELERTRRERDKLKQKVAEKDDDLRAEMARADRANTRAEHNKRVAAAHKAVATKLKKRVVAGVCPCCNRHFRELQRHMQTQHPTYPTTPLVNGDDAAVH